jgi:carbonic anhydrase
MDVNRRSFLKGSAAASALALGVGALSIPEAWSAPRPDGKIVTPADALGYLREGNARWASGNTERKTYAPPGQSPEAGQWPFAAIVSCSDSRVVPEDMFDVAGKNLFIIRNAGNVIDDVTMGSLEYAVEHTGISLIVALGHANCGAVSASQESLATGTLPGGFVDSIVERIMPALVPLPAGYTLDDAVAANAAQSAQQIQDRSPVIAAATDADAAPASVGIVKAVYGLSSRRVTFF